MRDLIKIIQCDCGRHIAIPNAEEIRAEERKNTIREIEKAMYHQCFECDNDEQLQKWDSGNWFRYKLFENVMEQLKEQKNES